MVDKTAGAGRDGSRLREILESIRESADYLRAVVSTDAEISAACGIQADIRQLEAILAVPDPLASDTGQANRYSLHSRLLAEASVRSDRPLTTLLLQAAEAIRLSSSAPLASSSAPSVADSPTWQPIDTAPKTANDVLLWNGDTRVVGMWTAGANNYQWRDVQFRVISPKPTHWMPMPEPPSAPAGAAHETTTPESDIQQKIATSPIPVVGEKSVQTELGLHVDMLDVDKLRSWAQDASPGRAAKLSDLATRLEQEIRDVGELRVRLAKAEASRVR